MDERVTRSATRSSFAPGPTLADIEAFAGRLRGQIVRLQPMRLDHVEALAAASAGHRDLYKWSFVPEGVDGTKAYVERALAWRAAGTALPFVVIRQADGEVIGSTRFFNIERWDRAAADPRHGRAEAAEIGYSWLAAEAVRTGANVEAKMMLLSAAFEAWDLLRVCFHADARNERSRNALQALGASFEGFLRAHRLGVGDVARTSARFSILRAEWPAVREHLSHRLARHLVH